MRGTPARAAGTLDGPIGRHPVQRKKMAILAPPHGRSARTDYRVRQTLRTDAGPVSLVECNLHTGRTHQIRVHLKHLGHPILGDALYSGPRPPERQMLHAWKLAFAHPRTGEEREFCAPLPADFLAFGPDLDLP